MQKKSITITVTEPDIKLPQHLQKPTDIEINVIGLSAIDCANLLNSTLSQILKQITSELSKQNTNPLKIVN